MGFKKQRMKRVRIFSIEEVFAAIETYCGNVEKAREDWRDCKTHFFLNVRDDWTQKLKLSQRMRCFYIKGTICGFCGLEGKYFALERHPAPHGGAKGQRPGWHLNLYGIDWEGHEVLLTHDHWVPKAKGGRKGSKRNMKTLCSPCNSFKGGLVPQAHDPKAVRKGFRDDNPRDQESTSRNWPPRRSPPYTDPREKEVGAEDHVRQVWEGNRGRVLRRSIPGRQEEHDVSPGLPG